MTSEKAAEHLPLDVIERQYDRVQSLFPRIDAKINVIFAIISAEIALASVGMSGDEWRKWNVLLPGALFIVLSGISLLNLYRCTFPNVRRVGDSLVYFMEIANRGKATILEDYRRATLDEFRDDLTLQMWTSARIAAQKFKALKTATVAAGASLIPWVWLVAASTWTGDK